MIIEQVYGSSGVFRLCFSQLFSVKVDVKRAID